MPGKLFAHPFNSPKPVFVLIPPNLFRYLLRNLPPHAVPNWVQACQTNPESAMSRPYVHNYNFQSRNYLGWSAPARTGSAISQCILYGRKQSGTRLSLGAHFISPGRLHYHFQYSPNSPFIECFFRIRG